MPPKNAKYNKDEDASTASDSLTVEAMTVLLEQHRKSLSAEFKTSLGAVDNKLDQIRSMVEDHGERISSLETFSNNADQRLQDLESLCSSLREDNTKLAAKVSDLEGRSRRQNIRILGLPENTETGNPPQFFSGLLTEVYGKETLSTPPEVDRAHRSLAAKPKPGDRPRPVVLRLHRFQVKDLLVREARRRGKMEYRGHPIRIVEDYSPEVLSQRSEYRDAMTTLYKLGMRPALLFPARLRITLPNGEKKWLKSAAEARKYIDEHKGDN